MHNSFLYLFNIRLLIYGTSYQLSLNSQPLWHNFVLILEGVELVSVPVYDPYFPTQNFNFRISYY